METTVILESRLIRYTGDPDAYSDEFVSLLNRQAVEGYVLASIRWDGDHPEVVFQKGN